MRGLFSGYLRENPLGWLSRLRPVWFGIVCIPLTLVVLSMSGYSYAGCVLAERFYWTLWLIVATFVASGMVQRGLLVQRRRLAWAVRREKLEQSERMEGAVFELGTDESMEAAEINANSTLISHLCLTFAVLAGVAVVWSPVLPRFGFWSRFDCGTASGCHRNSGTGDAGESCPRDTDCGLDLGGSY